MEPHIKITGLGIEIYNKDFVSMKWNKALDMALRLGNGWRLPTIEEMGIVRSIRDVGGIGNFPRYKEFDDYYYWTSREGETLNSRTTLADGSVAYAYFFDIGDGKFSHNKKSYELRVRYVRDLI